MNSDPVSPKEVQECVEDKDVMLELSDVTRSTTDDDNKNYLLRDTTTSDSRLDNRSWADVVRKPVEPCRNQIEAPMLELSLLAANCS